MLAFTTFWVSSYEVEVEVLIVGISCWSSLNISCKAGRNPNTWPSRRTPRPADGATPQALHLRPRHHASHYKEQPDKQTRHRNNPSLRPAPVPMAGTHTAPLPQGPNNSRPGQEHWTYAQAVSGPANPNNSELRDRCSAKSALV
ncbi:hypothetical protein MHYP_G00144100 [Metynnis hypsauchen]